MVAAWWASRVLGTLEDAVLRELAEETGLTCPVDRLAYVADKPDSDPPILHVTFVVSCVTGQLRQPTNDHDANPIGAVEFLPLGRLTDYGFSESFVALAREGFPNPGYVGRKANIGL